MDQLPRRRAPGLRAGNVAFYDSGWKVLLLLVGAPLGFFFVLYHAVHLVFWALARGSEYRGKVAGFVGIGPMVGLNLLLPGSGLMAGGYPLQGWACLGLWGMVVATAVRYAALPTRNLTVMHLFAGTWAAVLAASEVVQLANEELGRKASQTEGRVNVHKQRVPTLEDPDLYPVRLEAFQLLLEAAADRSGNFDPIQKGAINRLKHLLRIEERTHGKLQRQISSQARNRERLGTGARLGRTRTFEKILELAVDHPAFESYRDSFLEGAANLLAIPLREARARQAAYERGEGYVPDESLVDSRLPGPEESASLSSSRASEESSLEGSEESSLEGSEESSELFSDD